MTAATRKILLEKIEAERGSNALLYVTGDRPQMETQISNDAFDYFVHHLDKFWPEKKITFIIHTNGGNTAAAWRIVNLLRIFCDDLEVLIPNKAHSAGTLISLGANRILMTKQATLGPIDPSLSGPLSPGVPGQPQQRVPVSVEAVQGYIDLARNEMGIKDDASLSTILTKLSDQVHPLVLGQIFRSRNQIRSLARNLLENHELKDDVKDRIIDFLCSESGSHDRTINRREAKELGLNIEIPSQDLYDVVNELYEDFAADMELRSKFDPMLTLAGQPSASFECKRVLIESPKGGSTRYTTKGTVRAINVPQMAGPGMPAVTVLGAETSVTFEGWEQE